MDSVPDELTQSQENAGQAQVVVASDGFNDFPVIHETGHLLGLGHSGPYNDLYSPNDQFNKYDSQQWSVMSYNSPEDRTLPYYADYTVKGTSWIGLPETPMPLDILAAQTLYGHPTTTALSGGQVFGFNCNISDASEPLFDFTKNTLPVITIWDAGQGNTLDLSGFSQASEIDLNPSYFSSYAGLTNNVGV